MCRHTGGAVCNAKDGFTHTAQSERVEGASVATATSCSPTAVGETALGYHVSKADVFVEIRGFNARDHPIL